MIYTYDDFERLKKDIFQFLVDKVQLPVSFCCLTGSFVYSYDEATSPLLDISNKDLDILFVSPQLHQAGAVNKQLKFKGTDLDIQIIGQSLFEAKVALRYVRNCSMKYLGGGNEFSLVIGS